MVIVLLCPTEEEKYWYRKALLMSSGVSSGAAGRGISPGGGSSQPQQPQQELEDLDDLFPPDNFSMVDPGVYRSEFACRRYLAVVFTIHEGLSCSTSESVLRHV